MDVAFEISHEEDEHRYALRVDSEVAAIAEYEPVADRLNFHHTYTEPAFRGRGLAAKVVRAALDDVREKGAKIVATCWFVADFVKANPEYADLVS